MSDAERLQDALEEFAWTLGGEPATRTVKGMKVTARDEYGNMAAVEIRDGLRAWDFAALSGEARQRVLAPLLRAALEEGADEDAAELAGLLGEARLDDDDFQGQMAALIARAEHNDEGDGDV